MKTPLLAGLLILAALALHPLLACGPGEPSSPKTGTIVVAATTAQVAQLVTAIGGDQVRVLQLIPTTEDPHRFSGRESTNEMIGQAEIVFYNGHYLEGGLERTLESDLGKPTVALAETVDQSLIRQEQGVEGNSPDPHIWHDPAIWAACGGVVVAELTKLRPAQAEGFQARLDAVETRFAALREEMIEQVATLPEARRVLVTAHDAFQYFGHAVGLHVEAIQGLSTEVEANNRDIEHVVDFLVQNRVPAVFVEASIPPRSLQSVIGGARQQGVEVAIGGSLFSDTLGAEGSAAATYEGMIRHNVRTIVDALRPASTTQPE